MISNAVMMAPTSNIKTLINEIMVCINECILSNEEYITFGFITNDIDYIQKVGKRLEKQFYTIEHSYITIEDTTICFMKVKWNKERFMIKHTGYIN